MLENESCHPSHTHAHKHLRACLRRTCTYTHTCARNHLLLCRVVYVSLVVVYIGLNAPLNGNNFNLFGSLELQWIIIIINIINYLTGCQRRQTSPASWPRSRMYTASASWSGKPRMRSVNRVTRLRRTWRRTPTSNMIRYSVCATVFNLTHADEFHTYTHSDVFSQLISRIVCAELAVPSLPTSLP